MFQTLKTRIKAHFNKAELKSILITFISIAGGEAVVQYNNLFTNLTKEALFAFGIAILRSLLKAIFITEIKTITVSQVSTPTQLTTEVTQTESV